MESKLYFHFYLIFCPWISHHKDYVHIEYLKLNYTDIKYLEKLKIIYTMIYGSFMLFCFLNI